MKKLVIVASIVAALLSFVPSQASASQSCGTIQVGNDTARVATFNVDCETGKRVSATVYKEIREKIPSSTNGSGANPYHEVEGFKCDVVLAQTELTCIRQGNLREEYIFASTQSNDHPGAWTPPTQIKPHLNIWKLTKVLNIDFEEGSERCNDEANSARVVVKSKKHKQILTTSDFCESGLWRSTGGVKGMDISVHVRHHDGYDDSQVEIKLDQEEIIPTTRYKVIAKTGHRRGSGWLTVRNKKTTHYPTEEKIWEGTDAFINYCIDKVKEIRSENGRLYCVRIKGHSVWWEIRSVFKWRQV